jgi:hypothetical protein
MAENLLSESSVGVGAEVVLEGFGVFGVEVWADVFGCYRADIG